MPLFDRKVDPSEELVSGSDAATRALSVTVVENDFVAAVYDKLAKVYDFTFGPTLHPGRLRAIERMDIQSGERVLEVGVGTGINLSLYPKNCSVTGIDFSESMLEIARERAERKDIRNVRLLQMDAADLKFADDSFDIVYAPYLISVVPDPVRVARRNAPRVPSRRPRHPPEPLPQPEPDPVAHRAADFALHDSHRLQGRSRSAGVSDAGRDAAAVDREGELSEDLVAGDRDQVGRCFSTASVLRSTASVSKRFFQTLRLRREQLRAVWR